MSQITTNEIHLSIEEAGDKAIIAKEIETKIIETGNIIKKEIAGVTAEKIRIANSAPLNPSIADIYFDTVEDGLFIAA
jgi:hypothetical protein